MTLEEKVETLRLSDGYKLEKKDGLFKLHKSIDFSKYANRLSAYSKILEENFKNDEIFVLSKIKVYNGLQSIFQDIFNNSKHAVMSKMSTFAPNYLIKRNGLFLLVTIDDSNLTICELPKLKEKTFIFQGFRYKIANKIKLK